jgi:hypothetical protein
MSETRQPQQKGHGSFERIGKFGKFFPLMEAGSESSPCEPFEP